MAGIGGELVTPPNERGVHPLGFSLSSWGFAARICLAAIVALYLSFWLQLEMPSTAVTTVAIIAEPTRGQALEKATFRVFATIIGIAASIAITGLFSQTRDLLLIAYAGWMGLCVYVSGLLDGNRAYAAVLSGYTVALVAIQQIDHPRRVFETGMARGAAILVGIASVAIVDDLLSAPERHTKLAAQLADIHRRIRAYATAVILGQATQAITSATLLGEIAALRPELTSLAFEGSGGSIKTTAGLSVAASLVAELHAARSLEVLPVIADGATSARIVRALERNAINPAPLTLVWSSDTLRDAGAAAALAWALEELLRRDDQVRQNLAALCTDKRPPWPWRALIYRSHRAAVEGGIRAAIWIAVAGMFLAYAGWPATSSSLALIGTVVGLGAMTSNSGATTALALVAAPTAGILAGLLEFVLDGVDGFPLLAIGLAPLAIGAALLTRAPNRMASTLGRLGIIYAVSIFSPSNPQTYDAHSYILSFFFTCVATGLLLATQFLVPPVSEDERRRWLLLSSRQEFNAVPSQDREHEPEEAMFRDAVRIGQVLSMGGTAPDRLEMIKEMLSYFDQSSIIRLCNKKLRALADGPVAELAEEIRELLNKREPQSLRDVSRALCNISSSDPRAADLSAALVSASYHIEATSGRHAHLDEAA